MVIIIIVSIKNSIIRKVDMVNAIAIYYLIFTTKFERKVRFYSFIIVSTFLKIRKFCDSPTYK